MRRSGSGDAPRGGGEAYGAPVVDRARLDELLRRVSEASDDGLAIFDVERDRDGTFLDLRLVSFNPAYGGLTGFQTLDIGRPLRDLAPAFDWSGPVAARMREAVDRQVSLVDHAVRVVPTIGPHAGIARVFDVVFTAVDDLLAVSFRDTTDARIAAEREKAEAARNAALARFLAVATDPTIGREALLAALAREIADSVDGMCLILDPGSEEVSRLLGAAGGPEGLGDRLQRECIGRAVVPVSEGARRMVRTGGSMYLAVIPDDVRAAFATAMTDLALPEWAVTTLSSAIAVGVVADGEVIAAIQTFRFAAQPAFTTADHETATALASAAALVFSRRATELELADRSAELGALFAQAPTAIIMTDQAGRSRANRAAEVLFGRDQDEIGRLMADPHASWMPPGSGDAYPLHNDRSRVGAPAVARFGVLRPSGERREVIGTTIPITSDDARPIGVISVLTDVTEQESLESQLRHAQKMEALGRLAGGIAHDFNNVLMAILGFAEFVAADARTGRVNVDDVDTIVTAARSAIDLTARLTAFSRREGSSVGPLDLADALERLKPLLRRLTPTSVELVTETRTGGPVAIDGSEFERIVVNLVVNAMDAMPHGGRLVVDVAPVDLDEAHVATHLGNRTGPHMRLTVSDTGQGMDETTRARLFEPFFTTKPLGEGTGLGLSSVYGAVERAGGGIWVYSEPGLGSTFRIYLPVAVEDARRGTTPGAPEAFPRGSESILLLEDDDRVRRFLGRVLREHGYAVTEADRPSRARSLLEARPVDLLLTDLVMPEVMGDRFAAEVRLTHPDLPVVFMSGYATRALEFESGPRDRMLAKPISAAEILVAVREVLDGRADGSIGVRHDPVPQR